MIKKVNGKMFSTHVKKHEGVFFTKNDQRNENEKLKTQLPPVNDVPFCGGGAAAINSQRFEMCCIRFPVEWKVFVNHKRISLGNTYSN